MNAFDLTGKNALITGGSRGLGKAMAIGLARAGAATVIAARDPERIAQTADEIQQAYGRPTAGFSYDAADVDSIRRLFRQTAEAADGRLDILVNAAGVNRRMPTVDYAEADWDYIVDVNLKGAFFCSQEAGKLMLPRRSGAIIHIGSLTTYIGTPTIGPYGATKMGVHALVKSLAIEWGPSGIRVNGIAPGWFETDLNRAVFQRPGWLETLLDKTPLGRSGLGEDLADVAVFLASDAARYITGQMLPVDGGFLAGWHAGMMNQPPT